MMIKIDNLTFRYPNQTEPALRNVSLQVAAGEFVLLGGDSGSGKSTLLRCLNGLIPHMSGGVISGQVMVDGWNSISAGPQQMSRRVGFVFQNPEGQAVLDRVEPEIAFSLENSDEFRPPHGRFPAQAQAQLRQAMQARVAETMARLNLTGLRARPLRTLSGGERQKVALAGTLALRPVVLALDEPTSQLDPAAAADLLETLARLNREEGLTIVLAEHRLERVLPFIDRVVHLDNGRVLVDAPVQAALPHLPHVPPLVQVGRQLGWEPQPLTIAEGLAYAAQTTPPPQPDAPARNTAVTPLLTVSNLTFRYAPNGRAALQDVSLHVGAGEAMVVLGSNGSGKTTLLKCVVGLLRPEVGEGEVALNGRAIRPQTIAEICRQAAYLPQNPDDLLFADSVAAECRMTLRNHGLPVDEAQVARALSALGLQEVAHSYPRDLSVGQRQRVALAAVTMPQQSLVLLDEPTRGLDSGAKGQLLSIWRRWLAQGKGLLLITHDVELAAQIATQVIILESGQILAAGSPQAVFSEQPAFAPQVARLWPGSGCLQPTDLG